MKRLISLVVLLVCALTLNAQSETDWYLVKLSDKAENEYHLDKPEEFLSQRAVERRLRYGIQITESDLPVSPAYIEKISALGVTIRNELKWFNTLIIVVDKGFDIEQVQNLDFVSDVIIVNKPSWAKASVDKFAFEMESLEPVSDKAMTYGNDLSYGMADNQIRMLNGHAMHNKGFMGEGMVIAVLDAGFRFADQIAPLAPLFENDQILSTRNFVYQEEDVYASQNHGHGTMVLSTMGANAPGEMIGTAPNASYHLIVTEDRGAETIIEEYFWVDGAEYADSVGADIINSSLGYTKFNYEEDDHVFSHDMNGDTAPVTRGADIAASKGILVCNSAGNSGNNDWYYIGAPADADSILAVGAVDEFGESAGFSSHGPSADGRVKPNVVAQGALSTLVDVSGNITRGNGTSFSSPILAGAAACLWQIDRDLSNMEVIEKIQKSANGYLYPNSNVGYGIPDFEEAMMEILSMITFDDDHVMKIIVNPVENVLKLRFNIELAESFEISIYDLSGKPVYNDKHEVAPRENIHIPLPFNLSNGLYVITANSEAHSDKMKFIKL